VGKLRGKRKKRGNTIIAAVKKAERHLGKKKERGGKTKALPLLMKLKGEKRIEPKKKRACNKNGEEKKEESKSMDAPGERPVCPQFRLYPPNAGKISSF